MTMLKVLQLKQFREIKKNHKQRDFPGGNCGRCGIKLNSKFSGVCETFGGRGYCDDYSYKLKGVIIRFLTGERKD